MVSTGRPVASAGSHSFQTRGSGLMPPVSSTAATWVPPIAAMQVASSRSSRSPGMITIAPARRS